MAKLTIGVDTGGTFTDLVLERQGTSACRVVKVPSTPSNPGAAIASGIAQLIELDPQAAAAHVIHGTTVGLNALLTRKLGKAALVTNVGFRDLIEIGRQDRPDIYALHPSKVEPVIPRRLRFEVEQRSWPDPETGKVVEVTRPSDAELKRLAARVKKSGAESVAVCLLHSWASPEIETRIATFLEAAGLSVTTSAGLSPTFREHERFTTATINAALAPVVGRYIERLDAALATPTLALLQSSGGTLSAERAALEPARILLSGPAGGVRGAAAAAREAGLGSVVTLDMGGTSTDVAFVPGEVDAAAASLSVEPPSMAGFPMALPSLDMHLIGCGGGSLARVDEAGALHVGPGSAGADPGPVAYGKADVPTLTDAFVQLGRIQGAAFLAGGLELDRPAVTRAFEALAKRLGIRKRRGETSATQAAAAMVAIAEAAMGRAVSAMTLQRGRDPRALSLVAFGGAGGLMAAGLAPGLGIKRVLIPTDPGVLSARGLAAANFECEASLTLLADLDSAAKRSITVLSKDLEQELRAQAKQEGATWKQITTSAHLALRYHGQSFELNLPWAASNRASLAELIAAFHAAHTHFFGYALESRSIEVVKLTLKAAQINPAPTARAPRKKALPAAAILARVPVQIPGSEIKVPLIERSALPAGCHFQGPAVIAEYSGTTWVPPKAQVRVTRGQHLALDLG